jgi:hypothetical protein
MDLNTFLKKNSIKLQPKIRKLCDDGIVLMSQSVDGFHDDKHVFGMLKILDEYLKKYDNIQELNFDVLVTSVCWHDVWKAKRKPTNFIQIIYHFLYEGEGSRKIFFKAAKEKQISGDTCDQIAYAIRMHNYYGRALFSKRKTEESKILSDVDTIDGLTKEHFQRVTKSYVGFDKSFLHWLFFNMALVLCRQTMGPKNISSKYFKKIVAEQLKNRIIEAKRIWKAGW